jgi:hypothetical protein
MNSLGEFPKQVGGIIPHFFFDAIGRIVPGLYLLAGLAVTTVGPEKLKTTLQSLGVAVAVELGISLFLTAYFVGFFLGPLSYYAIEKLLSRKGWKLDDVRRRYGASAGQDTPFEVGFRARFGLPITDNHQAIIQSSWLCAYTVWGLSPTLGVLTSRWDAEALLARSTAVASLIPLFVCVFRCRLGLALIFLSVGTLALVGYWYHREKQVLGRFDLFLALPGPQSK